jgi:hypothetical protein
MIKLSKQSREILERYTPSRDSVTAFWDFYALYLLWFKVEGWQGKYSTGQITNEARVRLIRNALWASSISQAYALGNAVMKAVEDEFGNLDDEYIIPQDEVRKWFNDHPKLKRKLEQYKESPSQGLWYYFTVPDVERIFTAPFWRSDLSDAFGGPPWAIITRQLGKVMESLRTGDVDRLALAVDSTYDLEHNTGSILTKFKSDITKSVLDRRAAIGSLDQFIPLVSENVRSLIRSYLNMPNTDATVAEAREYFGAPQGLDDTSTLVERLLALRYWS